MYQVVWHFDDTHLYIHSKQRTYGFTLKMVVESVSVDQLTQFIKTLLRLKNR